MDLCRGTLVCLIVFMQCCTSRRKTHPGTGGLPLRRRLLQKARQKSPPRIPECLFRCPLSPWWPRCRHSRDSPPASRGETSADGAGRPGRYPARRQRCAVHRPRCISGCPACSLSRARHPLDGPADSPAFYNWSSKCPAGC